MKNKYSWRSLLGMPPLCQGGALASIVFCCNPETKECAFLDTALKRLGISKSKFISVMKKHSFKIGDYDLAFAPSLEQEDPERDKALMSAKMSLTSFLKYKFDILQELIPKEKMDYAFKNVVVKQYALQILDIESRKVIRALAFGDLQFFVVTEIFDEHKLKKKLLGKLEKTEYVAARLPPELLKRMDRAVEEGLAKSRSDLIRKALVFYLSSVEKPQLGTMLNKFKT